MGFATAALIPSILGTAALGMVTGGKKSSSQAAPAPAPAPAAPTTAPAATDAPLRAQRAGQMAAGTEIARSGNEAGEGEVDELGRPKRRAASRSILG